MQQRRPGSQLKTKQKKKTMKKYSIHALCVPSYASWYDRGQPGGPLTTVLTNRDWPKGSVLTRGVGCSGGMSHKNSLTFPDRNGSEIAKHITICHLNRILRPSLFTIYPSLRSVFKSFREGGSRVPQPTTNMALHPPQQVITVDHCKSL